jgi:hypothetical protein
MLEAVLILATLVQKLDVAAVPETRLEMVPAVTLRPDRPVLLRVGERARVSTGGRRSAGAAAA